MMFADEKQFTRIINRVIFMIENSLWLLASVKILELAIIISAAIRILKRINVVDIVSWDENEEMNELIE
jgi:hypothetical protein